MPWDATTPCYSAASEPLTEQKTLVQEAVGRSGRECQLLSLRLGSSALLHSQHSGIHCRGFSGTGQPAG